MDILYGCIKIVDVGSINQSIYIYIYKGLCLKYILQINRLSKEKYIILALT